MSGNPNPSQLDQSQIIQRAFDEDLDKLRVDASVTATIGQITISADDSTIAIKDPVTGNTVKVNSDGSIDANVIIKASQGDSTLSVGTEDGTVSGTQHVLRVDQQGNQKSIQMNALVPYQYDSIYPTYPSSTTEIYSYKNTSTTVATVTVIYTDASKNNIVSIVRT